MSAMRMRPRVFWLGDRDLNEPRRHEKMLSDLVVRLWPDSTFCVGPLWRRCPRVRSRKRCDRAGFITHCSMRPASSLAGLCSRTRSSSAWCVEWWLLVYCGACCATMRRKILASTPTVRWPSGSRHREALMGTPVIEDFSIGCSSDRDGNGYRWQAIGQAPHGRTRMTSTLDGVWKKDGILCSVRCLTRFLSHHGRSDPGWL